jgi:hypothetical protein
MKKHDGKRFFKLFGGDYMFIHLSDKTRYYGFGCRYIVNGELVDDTQTHWHKIAIGVYKKYDSWIRPW